MSENCWVLKGVDAGKSPARHRGSRAPRRPAGRLSDRDRHAGGAGRARSLPAAAVPPEQEAPNAVAPTENFPSYRGDALETSAWRSASAVEALRRLGVRAWPRGSSEAEALAAATAEQLNQTLQDAGDHLALHQRVATPRNRLKRSAAPKRRWARRSRAASACCSKPPPPRTPPRRQATAAAGRPRMKRSSTPWPTISAPSPRSRRRASTPGSMKCAPPPTPPPTDRRRCQPPPPGARGVSEAVECASRRARPRRARASRPRSPTRPST